MSDKNTLDQIKKPDVGQEEKPAPLTGKEEMGELVKTALWAIALAILIRSIFLEPFNIPSGSMKPSLLIGDYLFVNKPAYGYSRFSFPFGLAPIEGRIWAAEPKRGDVIVFRLPTNTNENFIKRPRKITINKNFTRIFIFMQKLLFKMRCFKIKNFNFLKRA